MGKAVILPLIEKAQEAIERGERVQARRYLKEVLLQDSHSEEAWLLLAQAVDRKEQTIDCLERVILLDPDNQSAMKALKRLKTKESPLIKSSTKEFPSLDDGSASAATIPGDERGEVAKRGKGTLTLPRLDRPDTLSQKGPRNWSIIVGGLLVILVALFAISGPFLAPRDPLEQSVIIKAGDKYFAAPYPMFTPGYPLGSDGEGRDLLSRILWGIRPTMILVIIVAGVRLALGTFIGLIAGWSTAWPGRMFDGIIAAAISIPVIIVALGGIAAVGVDLGIWAFVFALSLTGWVETARVVREQTQVVRGQAFIEAARSLGGTNSQILRWHVLRQVTSLLWMLFAFEISSTLLVVAALGFLGYYIGGDIWVQVTDATAAAVSGMPELGQMLATTEASLLRPWPLIVIGACVFCMVLGFNLLGEGLRQQSSQQGIRPILITGWSSRFRFWIDQNLGWPLGEFFKRPRNRAFSASLVLVLLTVILILWRLQSGFTFDENNLQSAFPQEHYWVSSQHDPFGTQWSQVVGPRNAQIAWTFKDPSGFSGGPVVAADGGLYIASNAGVLYALEQKGNVTWQIDLPAKPVGTPGLSPEGTIYVSDGLGGLSAISPQGEVEWHFTVESGLIATTGPIVSPAGVLYYAQGLKIQAVSHEGSGLWRVQPPGSVSPIEVLQLSADARMIFRGGIVLDAANGETLYLQDHPKTDNYFSGADGNSYLVASHEIIRWDDKSPSAEILDSVTWDHEKYVISSTSAAVGVTPDEKIWLLYTGFARGWGYGTDTRLIWLDKAGNVFGNVHYQTRNTKVIAVDQQARIFLCGNLDYGYGLPECQAFSPEYEEPIWKLLLEESREVVGGSLVPGRLYIATQEGFLYAISDPGEKDPSDSSGGETLGLEMLPGKEAVLKKAGEPLGPRSPTAHRIFADEDGFSGSLEIGQDGTLYLASKIGILYALNSDGEIKWQVSLPTEAVGNPAVGKQGEIYIADVEGGLSAYSTDGELYWHFQSEPGMKTISGPVVNPIGSILYVVGTPGRASIQSVSAQGLAEWLVRVETRSYYTSLQVSSSGDLIFFADEIYRAKDGVRLDQEMDFDFEVDKFISGQDGKNYLIAGGTIRAWHYVAGKAELEEARVISQFGRMEHIGVTEQGVVWMTYFRDVLWFAPNGQALGANQLSKWWIRDVPAVDRDYTVYACQSGQSNRYVADIACFALSPSEEKPIWEITLENEQGEILGGGLAAGRLYLVTDTGQLYLIEEAQ
ncbi:MAG: PQQ-binding-like beta-propeller repeat protein [Chloroflexota bacterium]|nr:MAG: PQQ-binding-like beta-propeller repeat protein [Chloroflexota bacterium]